MKKRGLCGEEITDGKYLTIHKCKRNDSRLVLMACTKCFNDEKYRETIMKISGI